MALTRRGLGLALAGLAATDTAGAQDADPLLPAVGADRAGRLRVPVTIEGAGPFQFAVDSAANATVIASDIAASLGLAPTGDVEINTLIDRERVPSVRVGRFRSDALAADDVQLILADRRGLGGVDGLLGTDLLAGYRLVMSFRGRRMFIAASRKDGGALFDEGRSTVRYRPPVEQRFGNLMMIDARAGRVPCKVIIDTGAQVSIINRVLGTAALATSIALRDGSRSYPVSSPTGRSQQADVMSLPLLGFGGVTFRRLPVLMGDFHTFRIWNLEDEPAILLGVDVLGLFDRVSIDLPRSELILQSS